MLNNKGFTVIELIMSFAFVSILTASLFAAVVNYKDKEQSVSMETELFSFKSKLTVEIQNDIQKRLLNYMEYCTDTYGNISNKCVVLNFMDGTSKTLEVKTEERQDTIDDSVFTYNVPYIVYGGIRYTPPDAGKVYVKSDYMLQYTTLDDDLENGMALYRIKIDFEHTDIEGDMDLSIVALGNRNEKNMTAPTYKAFNVGDKVTVQVNGTEQVNFYVVKKSSTYDSHLTLLLENVQSLPKRDGAYVVTTNLSFNTANNGNNYESSLIKSQIDVLYKYWSTPDVIRLITAEELGYLVYACPKYMQNDAPDLSLSTSQSWVYDSSYWTMSSKRYSNSDDGKKVWVVNKDSKMLTSDYVNSTYNLRPVIEIHKRYVTGWE